MRTIRTSDGVLFADERIVKVGSEVMEMLKESVSHIESKRMRLCTHPDIGSDLHEMFVVLTKDTYIRPHKHIGKSESFHIIEGSLDVAIFNDSGSIHDVVQLGDHLSGFDFYYRLSEPRYHTPVVTSDIVVFHETTKGPFVRSDTVYAPWAPEEGESAAGRVFIEGLKKSLRTL